MAMVSDVQQPIDISLSGQGEAGINWEESSEERLFGREEEKQRLFDFYRRKFLTGRSADKEILIISGSSGTGKTALARSLERLVQQDGGFFIVGKCDQIQMAEPFAPFVNAFSQFVDLVIAAGKDVVVRVEKAATEATKETENNVLIDMIPALDRLAAFIDEAPEGNSFETDGQLRDKPSKKTRPYTESPSIVSFCKFIKSLCSIETRLVMLLDDWQWLDTSSLDLVQALASTENLEGFMLVGTCRGDEVGLNHPLAVALRNLEDQRNVRIIDLRLGNLSLHVVNEMVAYLLQMSLDECRRLSTLAYQMTIGNPFYVQQFIRTLMEKGFLYFDNHIWHWDEEAILDNNVSLSSARMLSVTVESIAQASDSVKQVLQVASCLGSKFSRQNVHLASAVPTNGVVTALLTIVEKGLIVVEDDGLTYSWVHDRFQQAAHSLIQESERKEFHVEIGLRLSRQLSDSELSQNIFLVANLLCHGAELIGIQDDRNEIASLLCAAGEKAAQSSAFETAASYLQTGISMLPDNHWTAQYDLSLRLYNFCAEMECCLGKFKKVDELIAATLGNASNLQDKLRAYETKIYSYSANALQAEAIRLGFEVLSDLGQPFPRKVRTSTNLYELLKTKTMMRGKLISDILNLRPLRHWAKVAALRIMVLIFPAVLRARPEYALILTARGIQLTLCHGLSPMSSPSFSAFGMILVNPLGNIAEGRRYAEIGIRILEKFDATELKCRVHCMYYGFVRPWLEPVQGCFQYLLSAGRIGLLSGDIELAFINFFEYSMQGLLCGLQLQELFGSMTEFKKMFAPLKQDSVMFYFSTVMQLARNLLGNAEDPSQLVGSDFDANVALEESFRTKNASGIGIISLCKLFLAMYVGDYICLVELGANIRRMNTDSYSATELYQLTFLDGLAEVIAARKSQRRNTEAGKVAIKKLKHLGGLCLSNVANKISLIEAERYVLKEKRELALQKFQLAIDQAEALGFTHERALACELAGTALESWGRGAEALFHYTKAREYYQLWGSPVKCEQMSIRISRLGD